MLQSGANYRSRFWSHPSLSHLLILTSTNKGKKGEFWRKESKMWIWSFTSASGAGDKAALHHLVVQHRIQAATPESSPINHSLPVPLSNICVHLRINLNRFNDSCQISSLINENYGDLASCWKVNKIFLTLEGPNIFSLLEPQHKFEMLIKLNPLKFT